MCCLGEHFMRPMTSDLYARHWNKLAFVSPALARFALSLGEMTISEAAVERSYSAQSLLFNKFRSLMGEEVTEAQLFVRMNYKLVQTFDHCLHLINYFNRFYEGKQS